jgi:hypothetical protein
MKQFFWFALLLTTSAFADPSKPEIIKANNSKCTVAITGGEYPKYIVMRDKKTTFAPTSDGVVKALISPSGKYVALSAGEISLIDIVDGKFEFGVAIVNCLTGNVKGYRKGQPTLITTWKKDDSGLELSDFLNLSGNNGDTLP